MSARLVALFAIAVLISGCQTIDANYTLKTTDPESQSVRTNSTTQGTFILSRKRNSIVAFGVSAEHSWREYGKAFDIKIKNTEKKSIAFGAQNIDIVNDGQKSEVLDYSGIQRAIQEKQNVKEASVMFAAIAGGVGAGLYAGSPQANPALSSAITQGVLTSVQASTVSLANSKTEADVLSGEGSKSFLTNVVIPPGGTVGGIVVVPQIVGRAAEVTVTVGRDVHVFSITHE